eukprot:7917636-Alexandrium_andersonii.AAC.1
MCLPPPSRGTLARKLCNIETGRRQMQASTSECLEESEAVEQKTKLREAGSEEGKMSGERRREL